MKQIVVSSSLIFVDDDDYERLMCFNWHIVKTNDWTQYACCRIKGKAFQMHRMILDVQSGMIVDHKDHNGLNNQKSNLRICTVRQNAYNRIALHKNNTGYKGVHYDKYGDSYQVSIKSENVRIRKRFKNLSDAARFYDEQARKLFGDFAYTNF
jgi:hypothetical protein